MPTGAEYEFFKNHVDVPVQKTYKKWIRFDEAEQRYHVTRTSIRRWIEATEKMFKSETVRIKVDDIVLMNSELIELYIESKKLPGE